MKKKRMTAGKVLRWIAIAICIIIIICSAVYLIRLAWESHQIRQSSLSVSGQFVSENTSGLTNDGAASSGSEEETSAQPSFTVDFASLQAAAPNAVAWIQVSGIDVIDYPVVQYQDDSYYLTHSWDGQSSRYGAIFLEAQNASDLSDDYTLIYGHNMRDGSMFGSLKKYAEESFFQENGGIITIYLPTETRTYQIFSVRYAAPDDANTYTLWTWQDDRFSGVLEQLKNGSLYDTGVEVSEGDSILTLSTCAGNNRLVTHAVLVNTVPIS